MSESGVKSAAVRQGLVAIATMGNANVADVERLFEQHRASVVHLPDSGRGAWIERMESVRTPTTTRLVDKVIAHADAGDVAGMIRAAERLRQQLLAETTHATSCTSTGGSAAHQ